MADETAAEEGAENSKKRKVSEITKEADGEEKGAKKADAEDEKRAKEDKPAATATEAS